MSPRWILGGLLFVLVSGGAGYYVGTRQAMGKASAEIQTLQAQAAAAERSENEFKDEAAKAGEAGQLWAEQALGAGKRVEELRAKLAKLQGKPDNSGPGVVVGPESTPLPCDSSVLAVQAELIDAQDVKINALEGQVGAQQTQIAGLEKALKQADLKADIQAQASKAALEGLKKSRWLGRAEGFAAGLAVGYIGGKL